MKIGIFNSKLTTGHQLLRAFEQSMIKENEDYFYTDNTSYRYCDVAVIFGMFSKKFSSNTKYRKLIKNSQNASGGKLLLLEKGFIKRDKYFSLGLNDQCGRGLYFNENSPSDRFNKLEIDVKPWSKKGSKILLCGQIPWDTSVQHIDYKQWLIDTVKEIKKYTDREIIYRPHPKRPEAIKSIPGTTLSNNTLLKDFQSAYATVAYNSNSALESIIEGVPAFVFDKGSMVYNIVNKNIKEIESPLYSKREQTLYNIAYAQWNKNELASGEAWSHIKSNLK